MATGSKTRKTFSKISAAKISAVLPSTLAQANPIQTKAVSSDVYLQFCFPISNPIGTLDELQKINKFATDLEIEVKKQNVGQVTSLILKDSEAVVEFNLSVASVDASVIKEDVPAEVTASALEKLKSHLDSAFISVMASGEMPHIKARAINSIIYDGSKR